jgi:hypothetical protein
MLLFAEATYHLGHLDSNGLVEADGAVVVDGIIQFDNHEVIAAAAAKIQVICRIFHQNFQHCVFKCFAIASVNGGHFQFVLSFSGAIERLTPQVDDSGLLLDVKNTFASSFDTISHLSNFIFVLVHKVTVATSQCRDE